MGDVVRRIMKRQMSIIDCKSNKTNDESANILKKRVIDDASDICYMFIKGKYSMVSIEYYLLKLINGSFDW